MPSRSERRTRNQRTSASSSATRRRRSGSSAPLSSSVIHWNSSTSSEASTESAIARFLGLWKRSQSRSATKARTRSFNSPRSRMRALSAIRTCGATCGWSDETGLQAPSRDRQNHAQPRYPPSRAWSPFMNPALRLLAAVAALVPASAFAQAAPAPLTADTMWQLKRVGPPALSPDGKFAVYDVKRYDAENDKGDADLYLVPTAGGKPQRLTSMKGNETEAARSPDGHWTPLWPTPEHAKAPQ